MNNMNSSAESCPSVHMPDNQMQDIKNLIGEYNEFWKELIPL